MFTLDTERERVLGGQPRDARPETTPRVRAALAS
jgi:hypothetical protein